MVYKVGEKTGGNCTSPREGFAAKTSLYLMPVVAVLGDGTLLGFRKIGDRSGSVLPVGT